MQIVTRGLTFAEGPIALPDGDILVVETSGGRLTRVAPDGSRTTVADTGGGPNGAAIGPDGRCYICNNGGFGPSHRSEEHTSELQSLMRISYAVFCLKKKKRRQKQQKKV